VNVRKNEKVVPRRDFVRLLSLILRRSQSVYSALTLPPFGNRAAALAEVNGKPSKKKFQGFLKNDSDMPSLKMRFAGLYCIASNALIEATPCSPNPDEVTVRGYSKDWNADVDCADTFSPKSCIRKKLNKIIRFCIVNLFH
jgi:hypothetical protein